MNKLIGALGAVVLALVPFAVQAEVPVSAGALIKTASSSAIYYFAHDGNRYGFPNAKVYGTWYQGFGGVLTVDDSQMASFPYRGNVTYKPAVKMIKIQSSPTVYAVSKNGVIRPIKNENVAINLYGPNWNHMIDDVSDALFVNYRMGSEINTLEDFSINALVTGVPTIDTDKLLVAPPEGFLDYRSSQGFTPATTSRVKDNAVTWIVVDGSVEVASDPHPTHTDVPGLFSNVLGAGATYSFTFTQVGTWGYHNHLNSSQTGHVTVTQ